MLWLHFYHDFVIWDFPHCFRLYFEGKNVTKCSFFFYSINAMKTLLFLFVGVQAFRNSVTTRRCQVTCSLVLRNNGSARSIRVIHVVCFYGMLCKLLVVISTVVLVWQAYFSKFEHFGIIFKIVLINIVVTKNSFSFWYYIRLMLHVTTVYIATLVLHCSFIQSYI